MSEREALLRAIYTQPADDVARLVYADLCDEHGELLAAIALSSGSRKNRLLWPR